MMQHRYMILIVTGAASIGLLVMAARIFEQAQARQVTYDYLEEALQTPPAAESQVLWKDPSTPLVRNFRTFDEEKLGKAVSEAWTAFAAAQDSGETGFLPDHFSGVALHRARMAATSAHAEQTSMVYLSTVGVPTFYHLDGSVFQAKFKALSVRFAEDENGLNLFHASHDTNITTLMNESSGWRVYSHQRQSAKPVKATGMRTVPDGLAGINYYPAHTPWRAFWSGFDLSVIDRDFETISKLGANSVRIFLPRDAFLGAQTDANLAKLSSLLGAADAHDLWVVPTLFDLRGGYALSAWTDDAKFLQNVLPALVAHPAVAYTDLKNEPDLDFELHGRGRVEAWLRAMTLIHRDIAPDLPLTVGWSAAEHAQIAAEILDLITYHDYAPIDGVAARFTKVQRHAAGKPVMITEIGASAWSAVAGWPGSPHAQAQALTDRLTALDSANGVFVWTLHDFPNPDPTAVGHSPWVRNLQARFGLFDETGHPKPAAKAVAVGFDNFLKGHEK